MIDLTTMTKKKCRKVNELEDINEPVELEFQLQRNPKTPLSCVSPIQSTKRKVRKN